MATVKYLDEHGLKTVIKEIKKRSTTAYTVKGAAVFADADYLISDSKPAAITTEGLWQQVDGTWKEVTSFAIGDVYSITNAFTTSSDFLEGADSLVDAGMNIVVLEVDPVKFDTLGDIANLEAYQKKVLNDEVVLYDRPLETGAVTANVANVYKQYKKADGSVARVEYDTDTDTAKEVVLTDSNTTVEGAFKYIENTCANTPISVAEIENMFATL